MLPRPLRPASRRVAAAALGLAVAVPAAGCGTAAETAATPPPRAAAAVPGPDDAVLTDAASLARGLRDLTAALQRRHPRLRAELAPVLAAHTAQADLLARAGPEGSAPSVSATPEPTPEPPPRRPGAARALLESRERAAERAFTSLAVRSTSGPFARALAAMAASAAQARTALGGAGARDVGGPGSPGSAPLEPGDRSAEGAVSALQDALAAEHAALWLHGVLGARTSASAEPALLASVGRGYDAHRARRDGLVATLRTLGATPVPAAPAYDLVGPDDPDVPEDLRRPGDVRRAAGAAERATAGWWAGVVRSSVGPLRRTAVAATVDAAVRSLAYGGRPRAFPGADELGG